MTRQEFDRVRRVHLIGVGGSGMSGLALLLASSGRRVTGSDRVSSPALRRLAEAGVGVCAAQGPANILPDIQLVVRSQAIGDENPEYLSVRRRRIPCLLYAEAVGLLMEAKRGIAVAGTHGKTTTSALCVWTLRSADLAPSFIIGGEIVGMGNAGVGGGELLVAEACEYRRSFLSFRPEAAVVTNIEEDHLDYYRDIDDIMKAFGDFCSGVKREGFLVLCGDDERVGRAAAGSGRRSISYGLRSGEWQAGAVIRSGAWTEFECLRGGRRVGRARVPLGGRHNVLNALAVIALADELGVSWRVTVDALASYPGVHRRCELLGEIRGVLVYDDYGHHPTEIRATLKALKERYPERRLIVVFQPHQYSRTRFLLDDFAASFSMADKVVLPNIYFVRDSVRERKMVSSDLLADRIRANGRDALHLPSFAEIVAYLREVVKRGDIVLTLGAGPVNAIGSELLGGGGREPRGDRAHP